MLLKYWVWPPWGAKSWSLSGVLPSSTPPTRSSHNPPPPTVGGRSSHKRSLLPSEATAGDASRRCRLPLSRVCDKSEWSWFKKRGLNVAEQHLCWTVIRQFSRSEQRPFLQIDWLWVSLKAKLNWEKCQSHPRKSWPKENDPVSPPSLLHQSHHCCQVLCGQPGCNVLDSYLWTIWPFDEDRCCKRWRLTPNWSDFRGSLWKKLMES